MFDKLLAAHRDPLFVVSDLITDRLGITGALEAYLVSLQPATGLDSQSLRYVISLMACIVLSFGFRLLPRFAPLLHVTSVLVSLSFSTFCLGEWQWLHSMFSSLVTYALLLATPRRLAPTVVFTWAFAYMTAGHVWRAYDDWMGYHLDFSGPQMVLTLKVIGLAFCWADGAKSAEQLSESQRQRKIVKLPSFLEFLGFVYFFPSFLAGPTVEITDYQRFISGEMFNNAVTKGVNPITVVPVLQQFGMSLIWCVLHIGALIYVPSRMLSSVAFTGASMAKKLALIYLVPTGERFKYYFGWSMAEASFIATGMAYNGVDKNGKMKFDRYSNVTWYNVEFAENFREITIKWNSQVADWLRMYVYERTPAAYNTLATFVVSAFWHGIYPGYYAMFVYYSFLVQLGRECRQLLRPLALKAGSTAKLAYDVAGTVCCVFLLNYSVIPFLILDWRRIVGAYSAVYWAPHLASLGFFVLLKVLRAAKILRVPASAPRAAANAPAKKAE